MKKRIIFDLDGTLVDVVDFRESIRKTFEYFGLDYTQDNIEGYYQGMINYEDYFSYYGFNEYYLFLKKNCVIDFGPELIQHYISTPENLLPKCVDSNVFDTLDYLEKKYDLVVLTNYFRNTQIGRLRCLDLLSYFSQVYGGEKYIKPDKRIFDNAIGPYRKEDCIMIGDNINKDYYGAITAGIDAVLIDPESKYTHINRVNNIKELVRKL